MSARMDSFKVRMIFDAFFLINQAFCQENLVRNGSMTGQRMVSNWSMCDRTVTVFCPVGFLM